MANESANARVDMLVSQPAWSIMPGLLEGIRKWVELAGSEGEDLEISAVAMNRDWVSVRVTRVEGAEPVDWLEWTIPVGFKQAGQGAVDHFAARHMQMAMAQLRRRPGADPHLEDLVGITAHDGSGIIGSGIMAKKKAATASTPAAAIPKKAAPKARAKVPAPRAPAPEAEPKGRSVKRAARVSATAPPPSPAPAPKGAPKGRPPAPATAPKKGRAIPPRPAPTATAPPPARPKGNGKPTRSR